MTVGRARSLLSLIWIAAAGLLFLLFIVQSVLGKYGREWDAPWNWFIPLVGPVLTLIVGVWITGEKFSDNRAMTRNELFFGTLLFTAFYIASLYLVVFLSPLSDVSLQELFRNSGWYLGILQVFAIFTLHRFFVEDIAG